MKHKTIEVPVCSPCCICGEYGCKHTVSNKKPVEWAGPGEPSCITQHPPADRIVLTFCVVGDHPVMRRPDKSFSGENAQARAKVYASVLKDQGYENIKIEELLFSYTAGLTKCDW